MARPFQSLSIEDIQKLNRQTIEEFGGFYSKEDGNFQNRGSLEYIIEACIFPLFGEERYKTTFEKIAAIIHTIICSHVFHDGNKRTGLAVIIFMLSINGYSFSPIMEDNDFLVRIASENLPVEEIAAWLKKRAEPKI